MSRLLLLLLAALTVAACTDMASQRRPREGAAREYRGNFDVILADAHEEEVILGLTVLEDGRVEGSWDHTASVEMANGEVMWRTTGSFQGAFVSPKEFLATGSAAETPTLTGQTSGPLVGELQVRGTVSDEPLILGTLFLENDRRIMFQAVPVE